MQTDITIPITKKPKKKQLVNDNDNSLERLKEDFDMNECGASSKKYDKTCNKFLLKKELLERNELDANPEENDFLYPSLNDPNFIVKIAEKKEFNDTKYDGKIYEIKEQAEILANAEYELSPHQLFVRNFLSFQTPYNSLLLYHGLGTGKTCSAIGVCEEQRDYLKQLGINKRIIIVASPNVQDNFRLQLFDERKLKQIDGLWNLKGCVGNKLIKEINPMNMKGLTKEKVISQVKNIINSSYLFLGYIEFANYIAKIKEVKGTYKDESDRQVKMIRNLNYEFNNRLIVIDEIHNIRIAEENKNKKVALELLDLVKSASNMRLLLLSATPMYNSYKEIIWLINLMNLNDRRATIEIKDVFDTNGKFKTGPNGEEEGKELLIRKATGYVSFVRGENPYIFPFRIYPSIFSPQSTFETIKYPKFQMNGKQINPEEAINVLKSTFYLTKIGKYQSLGYQYAIDSLKKRKISTTTKTGIVREMPNFENMEAFGYTLLQVPLETLNIVYPIEGLDIAVKNMTTNKGGSDSESESTASEQIYINAGELTGKKGLERVMEFKDSKNPPEKGSFEYKKWIKDEDMRIFSPEKIGDYSCKIKSICDNILSPDGKVSDGIILIYSQYIDGGLIPVALALEEMGFTRYGDGAKSLFKTPPTEPIDVRTMKPRENKKDKFIPAKYIMITGDSRLSPNNDFEVKAVTNDDNSDGHKIKVVLISQAGSEGVDFKCLRQVHIIDPWYNMNRIEQIIGRGVRNSSHKNLDFEKRNVQLFIYGTLLDNDEEEAADMYVFRVAEYKAVQMGRVSRLLKETAVDCLINNQDEQSNFLDFTKENIAKNTKKKLTQILSNGTVIEDFKAGDIPYSATCDYMADCQYKCIPDKTILPADVREDTYNEKFIIMNSDKIVQKIKKLFSDKIDGKYFYKKNDLIHKINTPKPYPIVQIYAALTQLIEDANEPIMDKYGRSGYLINIGDYYLFQPSELNNKKISIFERSVPIDYKHNMVKLEIKSNLLKDSFEQQMPLSKTQEKAQEQSEREASVPRIKKPLEKPKVLKEMETKFDSTMQFANNSEKVSKGDHDWYKHCGVTIRKLIQNGIMNMDDATQLLIENLVDMLSYHEKIQLMNYIYSLTLLQENTIEYYVKKYLETKIIKTKRLTSIILFSDDKTQVMILKNKKWIKGEAEDEIDIASEFLKIPEYKTEVNNLIGFIGEDTRNKYLIFKVKDMEAKRNTGARCDEAGKEKKIKILKDLLGEEMFDKYTQGTSKGMLQPELCSLQEMLFRYYNKIKKNNKRWFFDHDLAMTLKSELKI
jgi:hypothetical protein